MRWKHRNMKRRTLIGTLAVASIGTASTGASTAKTSLQDSNGGVEDYADRSGRITHIGVGEAFGDYSDGNIDSQTLDEVINAWSNARRVVDKDVRDLSSNIDQDRTLEKHPDQDNPDEAVVYNVSSSITVNAELTVEAGVVVEFQQGTGMTVGSDGTIIAEGTGNAGEGILLTATNPTRGWHDGVRVNSEDLNNTMAYVTVQYGGREFAGNVEVYGQTELRNCTLRLSGDYGLAVRSGGELLDHGGSGSGANTYLTNESGAAYVRTSTMHMLSADSTYTVDDERRTNDEEWVFVDADEASGAGRDSEQRTVAGIDVPYRMSGGHFVDQVEWIMAPGGRFEFTESSELYFGRLARMTISGIERRDEQEDLIDTIVFTGTDKQSGWWDGIYAETTDDDNLMEHVAVRYAGDGQPGNLTLGTEFREAAELTLRECSFRHSAGHGLYCGSNVVLNDTGNNTYTENAAGPARIQGPTMNMLSETSDFQGNDNDHVLVSTNNVSGAGPDSETITWDALNVPWRINGQLKVNEIELVIDSGGEYEFTDGSELKFNNNARMLIEGIDEDAPEGEMDDPITFSGVQSDRGHWNGIYAETTIEDNVMRNVVVEHGGNGRPGNLTLGTEFREAAELEISNCTFRDSAGYGLYCGTNVTLNNAANNLYTSNADGPAYLQATTMHMLSSTSDFSGNDNDYVLVATANQVAGAGPDRETITWDALNVPWRVDGSLGVDEIELVIDPGATFEFTESSRLSFYNKALMTIRGFRDDTEEIVPITFTGTDKQSGWWDGIYTQSDQTDNVLEHVIVEYGGDDLSGNLEVGTAFRETGLVTIQDCTFRHADAYGLYAGSTTEFPDNKNNTYTDNVSGAASFRMDNIHYLSSKSDFQGNTNDIVEVRSGGLESGDLPSGETVATWDGINVPYEFTSSGDSGTTHSVNDVELQINPGATMQFQESGQLRFKPDSTLSIEGTDEDPITFTGLEEVKGWWDGIYVETNSFANVIDHAVIEYGGRGAGNNGLGGNIEMGTGFRDDASLEITNSTISHSRTNGIYADVNDQPGNANTIEQDNDFFENNGEDYATCDDNC
jgi:hypothetical protein